MNWNNSIAGNWIFSENALANSLKIKNKYDHLALEYVSEQFNVKFERYSPWMSYFSAVAVNQVDHTNFSFTRGTQELFQDTTIVLNDSKKLLLINRHLTEPSGRIKLTEGDPEFSASIDHHFERKSEFSRRLDQGLQALKDSSPLISRYVESFFLQAVPVRPLVAHMNARCLFSSHLVKGAIFIHYPDFRNVPASIDAIDLFHEIGHQVLIYYLTADPLIAKGHDKLAFSGARGTLRPALRSLHSAVALTYMSVAAFSLKSASKNAEEIQQIEKLTGQYQHALKKNLDSLMEVVSLTPLGYSICEEMLYYAHCQVAE